MQCCAEDEFCWFKNAATYSGMSSLFDFIFALCAMTRLRVLKCTKVKVREITCRVLKCTKVKVREITCETNCFRCSMKSREITTNFEEQEEQSERAIVGDMSSIVRTTGDVSVCNVQRDVHLRQTGILSPCSGYEWELGISSATSFDIFDKCDTLCVQRGSDCILFGLRAVLR